MNFLMVLLVASVIISIFVIFEMVAGFQNKIKELSVRIENLEIRIREVQKVITELRVSMRGMFRGATAAPLPQGIEYGRILSDARLFGNLSYRDLFKEPKKEVEKEEVKKKRRVRFFRIGGSNAE